MKRTLVGLAAAILLPAGIAAAAAAPAAAAPPPAPDPAAAQAASPAMLAAMQRDLGLTADQARTRLAKDDAASRTELRLRKTLGAAFAGAWLTDGAAQFVVAVTDARQAAKVTAAGATPKVVSRSERGLDAVKARLDAAAAKAPAASVPGWYVDVRSNTVVVLAKGGTAAAKAFVKASGADAAAVRVVASTETPRTLYDVRGGDAYYIGGGRCSVGFSVNGGFVTAGHCGNAGNATSGYNQVAQGTFQGSSFPGNDYAWVAVNSNWTPQPWVNNYSGGNVIVAGSTEAAVGASICRSGSTTGWHCGTVQAHNQTVNYPQGTGHRPDPHQRVRRARRLRRLVAVRPAGAGRHLRRLRQLLLRRHDLLPAGQRDPLRVRPDAGHQRRRQPQPADRLHRLRVHRDRLAVLRRQRVRAQRQLLLLVGLRHAPRLPRRPVRHRLRPLPAEVERLGAGPSSHRASRPRPTRT